MKLAPRALAAQAPPAGRLPVARSRRRRRRLEHRVPPRPAGPAPERHRARARRGRPRARAGVGRTRHRGVPAPRVPPAARRGGLDGAGGDLAGLVTRAATSHVTNRWRVVHDVAPYPVYRFDPVRRRRARVIDSAHASVEPLFSAWSRRSSTRAAAASRRARLRARTPGGDDGGGGNTTLTYSPMGCSYEVTPPAVLGYTNLALDDTGPVDPTMGMPGARAPRPRRRHEARPAGLRRSDDERRLHLGDRRVEPRREGEDGRRARARSRRCNGVRVDAARRCSARRPRTSTRSTCAASRPDTTYYYQVGGGPSGTEVWSATQSFTTMPATGPITVGVFGDARDKDTTWTAVHAAHEGRAAC